LPQAIDRRGSRDRLDGQPDGGSAAVIPGRRSARDGRAGFAAGRPAAGIRPTTGGRQTGNRIIDQTVGKAAPLARAEEAGERARNAGSGYRFDQRSATTGRPATGAGQDGTARTAGTDPGRAR
jgi:hypothetical protein